MSTVAPQITCASCSGTGKAPMREDLWETLQMLHKMKAATAMTMGDALKWKGHSTAINNRLEDLRALGFVIRERVGKWYIYRPTKKAIQ